MADSTKTAPGISKLTPHVHSLAANAPTVFTTQFSIAQGVSGTQIPFVYNSMPGNQPQAYANTVFIWQTSAMEIPINTKPLNTWSVQGNNPNGDNVFTGLTVTNVSFLLGYAVGTDPKNVCATSFLPAVGAPASATPTTFTPSIAMTFQGATSVAFSYVLPPGARPQSDGDWVGVWIQYDESVLYSVPPTAFVPLPSDAANGNYSIQTQGIPRGAIVTLGYFRGGYNATTPRQTTLACSYTWQN